MMWNAIGIVGMLAAARSLDSRGYRKLAQATAVIAAQRWYHEASAHQASLDRTIEACLVWTVAPGRMPDTLRV
jgi:hypothetical protein